MNIEICKKCGNQFYLMKSIVLDDDCKVSCLHFFGVCRDEKGKTILECDFPLEICKLIEYETLMKKPIRYCYELSFFAGIKPDKRCPYFIEHQMEEWNSK